MTWDLQQQQGVSFQCLAPDLHEATLMAQQDLEDVCEEGWTKVDPTRSFPTFTTSRPRSHAGRKPAGVQHCTPEELDRWRNDDFRYPPYQYRTQHLMVSKKGEYRLPTVSEKEYMLGFPVGYTSSCVKKNHRDTKAHEDCRATLLGNTWSVPVIAWFLAQLFGMLGMCPMYTPQEIVDMLHPGGKVFLQSRLLRPPLRHMRGPGVGDSHSLVSKLAHLVSIKGEDILLSTPSGRLQKYHRLRASVPAKLWRWKILSGWQWKNQQEHINSLELRAVLTTLKWRIQNKGLRRRRFLHLTDSLVSLHVLTRGRSSSRKLRSSLCRINALLLVSSCHPLWGYVHTSQNPADRPSRWGRRARTKFRDA